ncbi:MAG: hypothetical protein A2806_01180 [Candidatus Terrybacteria bacterium RIFCSPHIGHO2_01_FULL_48_17]|uniref:R3H domain-containing protein n=1 Tax=Candidatus Terrybacteria bacterium RIFCSPHIGHO2_01_FULL_48_17 TaxID=1802362 RepID=A0A1G2PM60_9BACT|nr:MAG: hypothetical protein A2806_01180 [Candidatus Terrybacteria bacterium RIFCSPHIGHO2_01_FULL_48_17]OHA53417.1 MAG: hypothetical protein A3A30_02770 [Candidatus Terrybacteria bacterium RIFCSPLOWO2_01_FULL_48_14]
MEQLLSKTKETTERLLSFLGFPEAIADISEGPTGGIEVKIQASEGAGALIGEQGQGLAALEYMLRRIVLRDAGEQAPRLTLDVNGYRAERAKIVRQRARDAADEVRYSKSQYIFEPMSAFERRLIHLELAARGDVVTESQGEGRDRRVVIRPYP